jgi:hypothetical protein
VPILAAITKSPVITYESTSRLTPLDGTHPAGTWAAIFFSLIESCRMLKMDSRRYLTTVAKALIADTPPDPATLTPLALRDVIKVN